MVGDQLKKAKVFKWGESRDYIKSTKIWPQNQLKFGRVSFICQLIFFFFGLEYCKYQSSGLQVGIITNVSITVLNVQDRFSGL